MSAGRSAPACQGYGRDAAWVGAALRADADERQARVSAYPTSTAQGAARRGPRRVAACSHHGRPADIRVLSVHSLDARLVSLTVATDALSRRVANSAW